MQIKSKNLFFLLVAFVVIMLVNCRKDNEAFDLSMSGTLIDGSTNSALSGATVILKSQQITNGTWSGTFSEISRATTNANGEYTLQFKQANVVEYEISFVKDLYYTQVENINPERVTPEEAYVYDTELKPQAWLSIRVENVSPFDDQDDLTYNLAKSYDCPGCCTGSAKSFIGTDVDATNVCPIIGGVQVTLNWVITKNGSRGIHSDQFTAIPFDTTRYIIQY